MIAAKYKSHHVIEHGKSWPWKTAEKLENPAPLFLCDWVQLAIVDFFVLLSLIFLIGDGSSCSQNADFTGK